MNKYIYIVSVLIILVISCNENTEINEITDPPIDEIIDTNFLSIDPSSGVIGTKIKIFGEIYFDSSVGWPIYFSGPEWHLWQDSIRSGTLYTYIPFETVTGKIIIQNEKDSLFVKEVVVYEKNPENVEVRWSDLNYEITKKVSQTVYTRYIPEMYWRVDKVKDTIKLWSGYMLGDFYYTSHLKLLNNGQNQLPDFLSGYGVEYTDYGTSDTIVFKRGIIKIQDWNVEGLISGRVFSSLWNYNNYSFYYKFK